MIARKETFSIIVWVLTIAAGALMLKLSGFDRILIMLAVALVGGVVHLFVPLLVSQMVCVGAFAVVLVLLLWVAQWRFVRLPKIREALPAGKDSAGTKGRDLSKPDAPAKEKEQSKQDEE
jgi:hypothetical protein